MAITANLNRSDPQSWQAAVLDTRALWVGRAGAIGGDSAPARLDKAAFRVALFGPASGGATAAPDQCVLVLVIALDGLSSILYWELEPGRTACTPGVSRAGCAGPLYEKRAIRHIGAVPL